MSDERETKDNRSCIAFDCCGASFVFRISGKIIRHTLGDVLYDNRSHCIFCEKLPSIAEVKKVVQPIDEIFKAKMKPGTQFSKVWKSNPFAHHIYQLIRLGISINDLFFGSFHYRLV